MNYHSYWLTHSDNTKVARLLHWVAFLLIWIGHFCLFRHSTLSNLKMLTISPKVLEYLLKKGYTRTEMVLRQESANVDIQGRPIFDRAEDFGNEKYNKAFALLSGWIDQNLDIYKVS
jgi:hypothetical protein